MITDRVQQGDLEIQHKPTGEILADYESKPTRGTLFRSHRAEIINFPLYYDGDAEYRRTHPKLLSKNEADTTAGVLEMRLERVRFKDNEKSINLASNARKENFVTQAIVDRGKLLSQNSEKRPLLQ